MKLSDDRFEKGSAHRMLNGVPVRFDTYWYETTGNNAAIYCIYVSPEGDKYYLTNFQSTGKHTIHEAVEKHFSL